MSGITVYESDIDWAVSQGIINQNQAQVRLIIYYLVLIKLFRYSYALILIDIFLFPCLFPTILYFRLSGLNWSLVTMQGIIK